MLKVKFEGTHLARTAQELETDPPFAVYRPSEPRTKSGEGMELLEYADDKNLAHTRSEMLDVSDEEELELKYSARHTFQPVPSETSLCGLDVIGNISNPLTDELGHLPAHSYSPMLAAAHDSRSPVNLYRGSPNLNGTNEISPLSISRADIFAHNENSTDSGKFVRYSDRVRNESRFGESNVYAKGSVESIDARIEGGILHTSKVEDEFTPSEVHFMHTGGKVKRNRKAVPMKRHKLDMDSESSKISANPSDIPFKKTLVTLSEVKRKNNDDLVPKEPLANQITTLTIPALSSNVLGTLIPVSNYPSSSSPVTKQSQIQKQHPVMCKMLAENPIEATENSIYDQMNKMLSEKPDLNKISKVKSKPPPPYPGVNSIIKSTQNVQEIILGNKVTVVGNKASPTIPPTGKLPNLCVIKQVPLTASHTVSVPPPTVSCAPPLTSIDAPQITPKTIEIAPEDQQIPEQKSNEAECDVGRSDGESTQPEGEGQEAPTLADEYMKNWKQTGKFTCKMCPYSTVTKNYLFKHWLNQHYPETVVYKCQHCEFGSKLKHKLSRHYSQYHPLEAKFSVTQADQERKAQQKFNEVFAEIESYQDDRCIFSLDQESVPSSHLLLDTPMSHSDTPISHLDVAGSHVDKPVSHLDVRTPNLDKITYLSSENNDNIVQIKKIPIFITNPNVPLSKLSAETLAFPLANPAAWIQKFTPRIEEELNVDSDGALDLSTSSRTNSPLPPVARLTDTIKVEQSHSQPVALLVPTQEAIDKCRNT